ncbi:MAG: hypothetical protein KF861_11370 [Planctomycetaceae bacterium]|nr:hypothetical protein [Planctomycetaceae bacterium]
MAKQVSGKYWVTWADTHAKNSTSIDDLDADFKRKLKEFIQALEAGGATVKVEATKRSDKRAYLFHWCWKIALGKAKPSEATTKGGVDIQWDHGDAAKSKAGAQEMVSGFGLAVPPKSTVAPSLNSNHIAGKAVDMEITWAGTKKFKNKQGKEVEIPYMSNPNMNTKLHELGATYGVKKLKTDRPHWSHNGT